MIYNDEMSESIRYAAYGSNLHPLRLGCRLPGARLLGPAALRHWSLRFHKRSLDGSGKCDIVEGGNGVYVAVYGISTADGKRLDAIEGAGYSRRAITISGYGRCFAYLAEPAHIDDALHPYDWYLELVALGAAYHEFPAEYVETILSTASATDPDRRRQHSNMTLAHRLRRGPARA